jgi:hypothetical protein
MWGWWQEEEDGYDNDNSFAILDRILAGGEGDDGGAGGNSTNNDPYAEQDPYAVLPLDYTILSYGIATLYLILIVESIRHYIDHAAHGRPFFKAVLLTAYSECKYAQHSTAQHLCYVLG